jgi:hypothetical protein
LHSLSGVRFQLALVRKLYDGEPDYYQPIPTGTQSIADRFDYVMHGKIFKFVDDADGKLCFFPFSSLGFVFHFSFSQMLLYLLRWSSCDAAWRAEGTGQRQPFQAQFGCVFAY